MSRIVLIITTVVVVLFGSSFVKVSNFSVEVFTSESRYNLFNIPVYKVQTKFRRCNVISKGGGLSCKVALVYVLKTSSDMAINCERIVAKNALIVVTTAAVASNWIKCKSNNFISANMVFRLGIPLVEYTDMTWKRISHDYTTNKTFRHEIKVHPKASENTNEGRDTLVKYELTSNDSLDDKITILWYRLSNSIYTQENLRVTGSSKLENHLKFHHPEAHWMTNTFQLTVEDEIVFIPCLYFTKEVAIYRRVANKQKLLLPVDNYTLSYDPTKGFYLNTSRYENYSGEYDCSLYAADIISYNSSTYTTKTAYLDQNENHFNLKHPEGFEASPNFTNLAVSTKESFKLKCSSSQEIIMYHQTSKPFAHLNGRKIMNWTFDEFSITYYQKTLPVLRFFAVFDAVSSKRSSGNIFCSNKANATVLHKWVVETEDKNVSAHLQLKYFPKQNIFKCSSSVLQVKLLQIRCSSIIECQIFLKCFTKPEVVISETQKFTNLPEMECGKSVDKGSTCGEFKNRDKTAIYRDRSCEVAVPYKKGLLHCTTVKEMNEFLSGFSITKSYIYFIGFDSKFYIYRVDSVPIDAVLKVELVTKLDTKFFHTQGWFSFRCTAHSFYFVHGLQWLFVYSNGTVATIEESSMKKEKNKDDETSTTDMGDILSEVKILITDNSINQIVCVAPLWNSSLEWNNATLKVHVRDAIPPTIITKDTLKLWKPGDKDLAFKCEATGFPKPDIEWYLKGEKTIRAPLKVVEDVFSKLLLIPNHSKANESEYLCKASNILGYDKKKFKVGKYVENDRTVMYATIVSAAVLALISTCGCVLFLWIKKRNKYRAMKEIIRILNGNEDTRLDIHIEEDANITAEHTAELPFDITYDIAKESFLIDSSCILGFGEFGEVFKGRLNGVEGFVAFKSVKRNCPIVHLKSLVMELKIMMYIGEHSNLIKLYGAYREDINKGILYVALEYCDLGSLHSYLRNNKHIFLKCPIISANNVIENGESETKTELKSEIVVSSFNKLHSIRSLLLWSFQIANGMEYLASKKVVHSDLAARNVLLTTEGDAKVADFGLSRQMHNYTCVKESDVPLPWRWAALETLLTNTLSSQSDVWAYGITLWEIFSLGEVPYPGMEYSVEFPSEIEKGLRNKKPKYSSEEIYNIMLRCWHEEPSKRPTFTAIRIIFNHALSKDMTNIDRKVVEEDDILEMANALATSDYVQTFLPGVL